MLHLPKRSLLFAIAIGAAAASPQIVVSNYLPEERLVITGLVPVESRDVDDSIVEEKFTATLRHTGTPPDKDFARVVAHVAQLQPLWAPGFARVVDGDLSFGTVRAGQTVQSHDTITIRRHRSTRIDPARLRWTIDAHPDMVPSDAWAGRWRFTITRKDVATDAIVMVGDITDTIGPGQPVGFSLLPEFVRCRWTGTDDRLDAACSARARVNGCLIEGTLTLGVERSGETLGGRGLVAVENHGTCAADDGGGSESIDLAGVRDFPQGDPEPFSFGLLPDFVMEPGLAQLLTDGLKRAQLGEPVSDDDCGVGGWRRFATPSFMNERDCRSYCRQRQADVDWRRR